MMRSHTDTHTDTHKHTHTHSHTHTLTHTPNTPNTHTQHTQHTHQHTHTLTHTYTEVTRYIYRYEESFDLEHMIETQRKQVIFPPPPPPQTPPTNTIIDCFLFTECFSHVPTVQHQSEAKLLRLLHKNHDTLRLRQESTNLADTRKMNTGD
jgi:hypothetical protein